MGFPEDAVFSYVCTQLGETFIRGTGGRSQPGQGMRWPQCGSCIPVGRPLHTPVSAEACLEPAWTQASRTASSSGL